MAGRSEFPERAFEFAFNSEVVRSHASALTLGTPWIPSQSDEWFLGFDAGFALTGDRFLFFQYKVGYHAEHARGTGAEVYDLYKGPYMRFRLSPKDAYHQHNTLVRLQTFLRGHAFFYVVPLFGTLRALQGHMLGNTLLPHCGFVPVRKMREIPATDTDPHSITHSVERAEAHLHSEPQALTALTWEQVRDGGYEDLVEGDPEPLRRIRSAMGQVLEQSGQRRVRFPEFDEEVAVESAWAQDDERRIAAEIAYLCSQRFDLSWLRPESQG